MFISPAILSLSLFLSLFLSLKVFNIRRLNIKLLNLIMLTGIAARLLFAISSTIF